MIAGPGPVSSSACAHEPQVIELALNFVFGSNAGVKGRAQAGLFEQPASFLANLHPLLVGLSIAPFVQQAGPTASTRWASRRMARQSGVR